MAVWFITGASRGFGHELASAALADGDEVVATARDPLMVPQGALPLALDVTDEAAAEKAASAAVDEFGRIDVLVNNAGYGLFGSVEEITDAQARNIFDTNVFGLLNVTRAVVPRFRRQGFGHVVNLSSAAGFVSSAGRGLYSASKFAVEAISEALHEELDPLGIHVTVVEPGSLRTEFLSAASVRTVPPEIPAYYGTVGSLLNAIETFDGDQAGDPARSVDVIRQLTTLPDPPLRLALGSESVQLIEGKLAAVTEELHRWKQMALSTEVPES